MENPDSKAAAPEQELRVQELRVQEQREQELRVEVAYALPQRQRIIDLHVQHGATAWDAVQQSGIALEFPDLDLDSADMGIFSKPLDGKVLPLPKDYRLKPRDRVEIYRPLLIDPKAARQARAARARDNRDAGDEQTAKDQPIED